MGIFRRSITDDAARDYEPTKVVDKDKVEYTDISSMSENVKEDSSKGDKKQKMEEIYSTKDKHIRYKNQMPLEVEARTKKQVATKEGLKKGEVEIKLEDTGEIDDVEIKTILEEGTIVSKEIIEDVGDFKNLKTIHSGEKIDFNKRLQNYREDDIAELPTLSDAEKVINTIPVYLHDSRINKIQIKAGRFSEIVENEYDQYLIYSNPTSSKQTIVDKIPENKSLIYHLSQFANKYKGEQKAQEEKEELKREIEDSKIKREEERATIEGQRDDRRERPNAPRTQVTRVGSEGKVKKFFSKIGRFFVVIVAVFANMFVSKNKAEKEERVTKRSREAKKAQTGPIDYQDRQDEKYVLGQIKKNIRILSLATTAFVIVLVLLLILAILESSKGEVLFSQLGTFGPILYCIINFVLLIVAGIVYRNPMIQGLKALKKIKGNVDSAISIAYIGCLLQSIVSLFSAKTFLNGEHHLYSFIVVFAMLVNTIGRLFIEFRVRANFKFITSKMPAYAAKTYSNEELANRMLHGTTARKSYISYQHETDFLSDFLKISYAPDPSEEMSGRFAPIIVVSSIFVGILYFIITKNFVNAVSSIAVMTCIGVPFSALIACNVPLYFFSKRALKNHAMVAGFPSVRQFCDTSAIMVKASDLYPRGSIKLESIREHIDIGLNDILLSAACVLGEAENPMVNAFYDMLKENAHSLPNVESVMYEDRLGIVGWVNGVRILIGNRQLMDKYHVTVRSETIEDRYNKEGKCVSFIASGGQLVAEVITSYYPNLAIQRHLLKAEDEGLCFVVSSTDVNLTNKKIADDYSLYDKTIKVLPIGYANECNECLEMKEETSRAYVATRGKFASFCKAITGCLRLKSNVTMSLIIEIVGIVLGILLSATMSLYAGVSRLTIFNLFLYILFWIIATLLAHIIRKP